MAPPRGEPRAPAATEAAADGSGAVIRHAAAVIALRDADGPAPSILMGQRGARAAFMPSKMVFPGGAVDPGDASVPLSGPLSPGCRARLAQGAGGVSPEALAAAAIRELWEETGQILGAPGPWPEAAPLDWRGFAEAGLLPAPGALRFLFRALTPPGRPRRFDARFFIVEAEALASDLDDFSRAGDELSGLRWVPLAAARNLNLPYVIELVLAEIDAWRRHRAAPEAVPHLVNDAAGSRVTLLRG
ncbi:NUDIX hydrolase [Poseidonocella sedimentorum]|uniref:Nudix hydrolase domain-containing protein n=1 Tax=Poseidonocella sedimentorum TaxID=871652 RepID=A0A1I6D2D0_9RHOB|nr:NUDIX hydrolase [Poseidonocella sedimentorum]SFQ99629.1 hypothetical protein SAMN04515673_1026 [Poseidonocella sedimentorum]